MFIRTTGDKSTETVWSGAARAARTLEVALQGSMLAYFPAMDMVSPPGIPMVMAFLRMAMVICIPLSANRRGLPTKSGHDYVVFFSL